MSTQAPLKQTIMSGQTVAGAMIFEFFTPGMSNILANAGARFAIYDMEHTGLGYETLKWLFATCRGLLQGCLSAHVNPYKNLRRLKK